MQQTRDTTRVMDMHGRTNETEDAEAQRALKQQWRKDALAKRKKTTIVQRQEAGRLLAIRARETALVRPGSTVAAFVSMGSEIPMTPLLETLFDMDCRVLVPRLGAGMEIGWSELDGIDGLRDQHNADGSEALAEAELVIVPAFAVDEHGFRLGRGGGWYDRALLRRSATARVIAVCWPWETTDTTVPHEPHDIPVDGTLTPDGYHAVRG